MNENAILFSRRKAMVDTQLAARGIKDKRVLSAFLKVPRDEFVSFQNQEDAYQDHPIDIGYKQTISQPYMAAFMTELLSLKGDEKILEIGTGSGYQAAILSLLCEHVFTIERIPQLAFSARKIFNKLCYDNIDVIVEDGSCGLERFSPYDRIIVTCAAPKVPDVLTAQLNDGGRLVMPIGERCSQELVVIEKLSGQLKQSILGNCVFVPLLGKYGWDI
jgi:protein-L-isoaspartate(D-aspartate) O-methyltransferase